MQNTDKRKQIYLPNWIGLHECYGKQTIQLNLWFTNQSATKISNIYYKQKFGSLETLIQSWHIYTVITRLASSVN